MKKVTLFIAAFIFAIGAFAQADCSKEVLSSGEVENGWGNLHSLILASDFKVEANETFNLTSLDFNLLSEPGIPVDGVTLFFYEDSGNGPGTELGMQEISEFEVTDLGAFSGFDLSTLSMDLEDAVEFTGDAEVTTTYWVGVTIAYGGESSYMEVTENFDTDNASYFFDDATQTWVDGASFDGFESFSHAIISLHGGCTPMGVEDFVMSTFTHFTQNGQLFVESAGQIQEVAIYNLLGQQVISETVNATSGSINLGSLNAGVYLTKVNVDGFTKTFKFAVK